MKKLLLASLSTAFFYAASAQNAINVSGASFTLPLVEKWVSEYVKENPKSNLIVTSDRQSIANARVVLSTDPSSKSVARFLVLPIANADNSLLQSKKIRKGINEETERELFVKNDDIEAIYEERERKEIHSNVYTLAGNQNVTTALFARLLHANPGKLKGRKILGSEDKALAAVKKDNEALSFNVANLIYNKDNRRPVEGIAVIAPDINGNGRVSEEERQAVSDIDALISYVENVGAAGLAIGSIEIQTDDPALADFAQWVSDHGQSFLNEYGFLRSENQAQAQR
jgi:ABC-type phosphate transport system substrate-binding protein